ncbi:MAG: nickel pincer cofactor biosynthesis protein LarB [Actinomycetaceae bacterium]|nr:nickel pincer cofactor biosynthesis protein LarB [Actinomycetaceae bacterium]
MSDANLDFGRFARRGYPEAIYCEGKSASQVRDIARLWKQRFNAGEGELGCALFTRANAEHARAVLDVLPDALYDETARLLAWPAQPPQPSGGRVVVACAGTSDVPIAREAALTARYLGREVVELVDVGVAGLDRILSRRDVLESADVIVVVAGMEGALASVVAGLVACPVVAVPTSVGYGAAFGGVAALLGMLNACAPGVGVVNIDNGYGAGHLAAQIAATGSRTTRNDIVEEDDHA